MGEGTGGMWSWASWPWQWQWCHVLLGVACLCMHVVVVKVIEVMWWRPRRLERHFARHGVRGPGYRFFVGSSIELVRLMTEASCMPMVPQTSHNVLPRVLPFYHHWRKLYGPKFLIWFGRTPRLTISNPDLISEVLLTRSEHFDRYEAPPLICLFEGRGLSNLHGDQWARHRKVLNPAFHAENLKLLVPFIGKTVLGMLERLSETLPPSGEVEVDVADWFQQLPEEVITFATFGRNYSDGKVVFRLQSELASYATEAHSKVSIPGYRFIPIKKNRQCWRLDKEIRKNLARFITELHSSSSSSSSSSTGDKQKVTGKDDVKDRSSSMTDFMSFMTPAFTAEETIEECKNFFFAGKETLSNLLTWATVALAMHPEWQERARREVISVCGRHDLPSKDHLPKLKTLGMVVNETLRLYPPAVAMVRKAKKDVELGGCVVPASTEILIPIMAVHHDAALWGPDAAEFNPGRFAHDGRRPRQHMAFMPFGGGARICIGQNMALMEAKLALAVVLQHFSFRLSPLYVHAPQVLMILAPQHGAPLIFRPL